MRIYIGCGDAAITLMNTFISDFLFYNQCHCIDKRKTAWFLVTTKKQSYYCILPNTTLGSEVEQTKK